MRPTSNEARLRALTEFEYWWCGSEIRHSAEPAGLEPLVTKYELATCLLDLRVCTRLKQLGVSKCRVAKAPTECPTDGDIEITSPLLAAKEELLAQYKKVWAEANPEDGEHGQDERAEGTETGQVSDDDDGFGAFEPASSISREDRAAAEFEEKFINWRKLSQKVVAAMKEKGTMAAEPAAGHDISSDMPGAQASVTCEEKQLWREIKFDVGPWMRHVGVRPDLYGHIPALARRALGRNNSASRCERDFAISKFFCGPLASRVDPWHVRDRTRLRMNKDYILWLDQQHANPPAPLSVALD